MTARNDEIRARLAAATPGPWGPGVPCDSIVSQNPEVLAIYQDPADHARYYGGACIAESMRESDRDLVMNAPADIAHLLALVEAAATLLEAEGYTRTADGLRRGALPDVMTGAGVR